MDKRGNKLACWKSNCRQLGLSGLGQIPNLSARGRALIVVPVCAEVVAKMMAPRGVALFLAAAVIGFVAGLPTGLQAQQPANTGSTTARQPLMLHGSKTGKPRSHKTSKNTSRKQPTTVGQGARQSPPQKEWALEDALPTRRTDGFGSREAPAVSTPELGRIPLESGSFGLETQTKVKSGEFSDGRRVPGLETVKRDPPSYFGLSLSVPTNDKSLLPAPIVPPWGRD
jgi:hypothetical protein